MPGEDKETLPTRSVTPQADTTRENPSRRGVLKSAGYHLHVILFAAMVLISTLPILLLGGWMKHSAMELEIASVTDKHLLIARNLSRTLSRYVGDVKEGFRTAVETGATQDSPPGMSRLLLSLGLDHVCIIDGEGNIVRSLIAEADFAPQRPPGAKIMPELRMIARNAGTDVIVTNLYRDADVSRFFLIQALDNNRFAVGSLGVDYIRTVQRAIAFGERGHSMIVDATGRVVAHPNPAWEKNAQDASKLSVVGAMMRGSTGVAQFYSPPMQADMIAGYTTVPETGWGVMVPQPMEELRERAADSQTLALSLSAAGILIAAMISWWLAKILARPIISIEKAADAVASGSMDTRVETLPKHSPRELHRLARNFDAMVDELQRREDNLRIAMHQAESANRAKTDFLANMSHELRTPLNGILGFADILRQQMFGPVGAPRYVDYSHENYKAGSHLLEVINDILDMAKVEANELNLQEGNVDLGDVVQSCQRLTEERAKEGNVTLRADIAHDLPLIHADRRMVTQILLNLVSNAIKFTPDSGTVTVTVALDEVGACAIRVADTGIGIEPEHLALIMKPFYQVETVMQRKYEGTGLGLPLVKAMAEIQGATLSIDSHVGSGTTATVLFPPEAVMTRQEAMITQQEAGAAAD